MVCEGQRQAGDLGTQRYLHNSALLSPVWEAQKSKEYILE
jgi:hypothetical protein